MDLHLTPSIPTALLPVLTQAHAQILDTLLRVDALLTTTERRLLCAALNAVAQAVKSIERRKDSEATP